MVGEQRQRALSMGDPARICSVAVVTIFTMVVLAGCGGFAGVEPSPLNSSTTESMRDGNESVGTTGTPQSTPADRPTSEPVPETPETPSPLPAGEPLERIQSLADADVIVRGIGADELGYSVAVGDVDGDDTPDLVVGAPFHNATEPRSGAVFVFFGPVDPETLTIGDADVRLPGEARGDWAGNSLAIADVSADGVDDLIVGAPRSGQGGDGPGGVYVVYGGRHLEGTIPLETADVTLVGARPGSFAGYSVAAANVTGDRAADIIVGAPRASVSGSNSGAVYLVDGGRAEPIGSLTHADATFVGEGAGDRAGRAVAVAGDVDDDGHPDLVIGARGADGAADRSGAAYIVTATAYPERASLADATVTLNGVGSNDETGFDVAGAGDVNGDGHADVLVGAPLNDVGGGSAGAVYVVYGSSDLAGTLNLANVAVTLRGAPGDHAGYSVGAVGDVTCDGTDDILVGAPWNDIGGKNAGAAYLVAGGTVGEMSLSNATATLTGAAPGDQAGRVDALVAIPGEETTGLVVGAPFGTIPHSVHVVYAGCPESGG